MKGIVVRLIDSYFGVSTVSTSKLNQYGIAIFPNKDIRCLRSTPN